MKSQSAKQATRFSSIRPSSRNDLGIRVKTYTFSLDSRCHFDRDNDIIHLARFFLYSATALWCGKLASSTRARSRDTSKDIDAYSIRSVRFTFGLESSVFVCTTRTSKPNGMMVAVSTRWSGKHRTSRDSIPTRPGCHAHPWWSGRSRLRCRVWDRRRVALCVSEYAGSSGKAVRRKALR